MINYVRVKITGLNLMRIIDKLVFRGVLVNDVKLKDSVVRFSIDEKYLILLDDICKKENKIYEIVYKTGFKWAINKLKYMFGFILAFVVSFCFIFSFNQYVFKVNVSCKTSEYDLLKVETFLKDKGVFGGMLKNKYKTSEIQNMVILEFNDVSSCVVIRNGGLLNIEIFPAVVKQEETGLDLLSKYNAIITDIEVFSGDANVSVGDIVKVGDVLIKNNNGASGKIIGNVCFSAMKIHNENQQILEKTGNYVVENSYKIFNKILINDNKSNIFSNYLIKKCDFYIFQDYILPIICERKIYYEADIKNVIVPIEEVEDDIKNELYEEIKLKIGKEIKDDDVTYSIVKDGGFTRIDCFVQVEMSLV